MRLIRRREIEERNFYKSLRGGPRLLVDLLLLFLYYYKSIANRFKDALYLFSFIKFLSVYFFPIKLKLLFLIDNNNNNIDIRTS